MRIETSTCKLLGLAGCCLLTATLLPACGGSSSTSSAAGSGGADSRTYQQGYAAGTVATLDIVLEDLRALQTSLAGEGAPAQTSRGTLGRSFALLAPRQRETLAASLLTFIARVTEARNAANAAGAGRTEAEAAQTAADEALQALQLVVAADTATRAGGGDAAQTAAINALNAIAAVDAAAPDATTRINEALEAAVRAAEAEVVRLEAALAAAEEDLRRAGQQQVSSSGVVADLRRQLAAAQARLDAQVARFGAPPTPETTTVARARTTYHPRRTGVVMVFDTSDSTTAMDGRAAVTPQVGDSRTDARVFAPAGEFPSNLEYDVTSRGTPATGGFDLNPDPVLFDPVRSNARVFAASGQNRSHFPGRGAVYRGDLRFIRDRNTNTGDNTAVHQWIYSSADRLVVQGKEVEPSNKGTSTATNAERWNSSDATPYMTFQYKPSGGFTMGFGGPGVTFPDLERYMAKGGRGPTIATDGRALASGAAACGAAGSGSADNWCDDPVTANVEISFGEPQADPYRQPNTNYWYVRAQSPRIAAAASPDLAQAGDRFPEHDIGRYEAILSSHAGTSRQLAYAAYGLFRFINKLVHRETPYPDRVGRMQVFHYGLDAFADRAGRRPADLTGDDAIEGTFRGKTAAWIVTSSKKNQDSGHVHFIQNMFRARGDIELRACIGDAACAFGAGADDNLTANQIAGAIRNLEYARQDFRGLWSHGDDGGIKVGSALRGPDGTGYVDLQAAAIGADGSYSGTAAPAGSMVNRGTQAGTYEGAFYGPAGRPGLETAGTWQLNVRDWEVKDLGMEGIIGSFGAVCTAGDCAPSATP